MSYNLILKDGTKVALNDYMGIGMILVESADKDSLMETWDKLKPENVSEIQITKDDVVIASFENVLLDSVMSREKDGVIITNFAMRLKTETELLKEKTEALESESEETKAQMEDQTETINMLTECLLEMSEAVYA